MNWNQVRIFTSHAGIEPVTALLLQLGVSGSVVEDAQDFAQFERDRQPHWDYVDESLVRLRACETSVTVYLAETAQGMEQLEGIKRGLARMKEEDRAREWGRLEIGTQTVCEEDWADNWKRYFKPSPVGERLLIKPTWETLDGVDTHGRTVLEIDPSASFGTGTHHTTRLCLRLLEECVRGGEEVMDLGCGSGILGIAALLLGARRVTAVDIDENSVRIARENFAQNGIGSERLRAFCGDVTADRALRGEIGARRYRVIAANIVADVLIALAPLLPDWMDDGAAVLLSGIIDQREEDVMRAVCANGLKLVRRLEDGGWVALQCARA